MTKLLLERTSCPNCGWESKRPDKQQEHNKCCALLPDPKEIVALLEGGMPVVTVAEKYSTETTKITGYFIRTLAIRFGLDGRKKWFEDSIPCSRCGILTSEDIENIPEWIAGNPNWFITHPAPSVSGREKWCTRLPQEGDPVCQMCYEELNNG